LPSDPGRTAPSICPDLICGRHTRMPMARNRRVTTTPPPRRASEDSFPRAEPRERSSLRRVSCC
jgi:hypothetical protein